MAEVQRPSPAATINKTAASRCIAVLLSLVGRDRSAKRQAPVRHGEPISSSFFRAVVEARKAEQLSPLNASLEGIGRSCVCPPAPRTPPIEGASRLSGEPAGM